LYHLSQADVLIDARGTGDLLGATKMDRPPDIETPDNSTLLLAIQHPDEGGAYAKLASHLPDEEDRHDPPWS